MARRPTSGSSGDSLAPPEAPHTEAAARDMGEAADFAQPNLLGLPESPSPDSAPPGATATGAKPYVVLARKYRPETFDDLIGQAAMVQTLTNAFTAGRIAQGFMLTGVRGVGKTTTARILARALNFAQDGQPDAPTIAMPGYGRHCADIIASRHPDVVEMDAASNTGVDNVREIIEGARYRPIAARYKVYIIDEVHMLSKSAFNALLKTLEEPPEHVKFIFATTEIRKVPVTVLSRCQRFDLRRVDVPELSAHLARIVTKEGAAAEPEALALIARAAEGSVRDALSILDQAIAMGAGSVTAPVTRAMLGLADRGRTFDLLETVLRGDAKAALEAADALNRDGADPEQLLADLAEAVHVALRAKVAGAEFAGEGLSAEERRRAGALAERLSVPLLSRAWQALLKGIEEASRAGDPRAAADMVLIRLAFTADLPTPDDVLRALGTGGAAAAKGAAGSGPPAGGPAGSGGARGQARTLSAIGGGAASASAVAAAPSLQALGPASHIEPAARSAPDTGPQSFAEVVALAGEKRDAKLKMHLEEHVSLIRFEPGRIEIAPVEGAPNGLAGEIGDKLSKWTGRRWIVSLGRGPGELPIGEVTRRERDARIARAREYPAVKAVLGAFPGAEIADVLPIEAPLAPVVEERATDLAVAALPDDDGPPEPPPVSDVADYYDDDGRGDIDD